MICPRKLVLFQPDIAMFRATQQRQDKAQPAGNGEFLAKGCNAVLALLCGSLRAGREAVARGVAPLGKDSPFPARRALRSTASRPADKSAGQPICTAAAVCRVASRDGCNEHGNIRLKEY